MSQCKKESLRDLFSSRARPISSLARVGRCRSECSTSSTDTSEGCLRSSSAKAGSTDGWLCERPAQKGRHRLRSSSGGASSIALVIRRGVIDCARHQEGQHRLRSSSGGAAPIALVIRRPSEPIHQSAIRRNQCRGRTEPAQPLERLQAGADHPHAHHAEVIAVHVEVGEGTVIGKCLAPVGIWAPR